MGLHGSDDDRSKSAFYLMHFCLYLDSSIPGLSTVFTNVLLLVINKYCVHEWTLILTTDPYGSTRLKVYVLLLCAYLLFSTIVPLGSGIFYRFGEVLNERRV